MDNMIAKLINIPEKLEGKILNAKLVDNETLHISYNNGFFDYLTVECKDGKINMQPNLIPEYKVNK